MKLCNAILLSLVATIVSGCSPSTSGDAFICGVNSCTGCCKGNTCVAPPDETACGSGGAACNACRANETCLQGSCVPANCAGCVNAKTLACEPGTAVGACGAGGAFCASCGADTSCQAGRCTSTACAGCKDGSGACQAGTLDSQCGAGGVTCAACTGGKTCQDRVCTSPPSCGPTTCASGCCDDADSCQPGTAVGACGGGGGRCATCAGTGATCAAGVCKQPCGPNNCAGCCTATGACVASVSATCGINGATCAACNSGDVCTNGSCVSTMCKSTCPGCCVGSTCQLGTTQPQCGKNGNACAACSGGQVCSNNACHVDPNSLWDLVITSGLVPLYNNPPTNTTFFDSFGGAPDPYPQVVLDPSGTMESNYIDYVSNSLAPDWTTNSDHGVVYSGYKPARLLLAAYMQMWDDDVGPDNDMGWCYFTITEAMFGGALQTFHCDAGHNSLGLDWEVKFKIVPH